VNENQSGPGCIAWKAYVKINPSKLERDWMDKMTGLPHRSEILQFAGSPFALEDLRSGLVSHLHNKGGTKSALHTGDYTSLPQSRIERERHGQQGLLARPLLKVASKHRI